MGHYEKIMEELDYNIRELERVKEVIAADVEEHKVTRWGSKGGSKSMFKRVKLNIRDSFRRIEKILDPYTGCDYSVIVHEGSMYERD